MLQLPAARPHGERLPQQDWFGSAAKKRVHYLGHMVTEDGVMTDPEKIETVREWPVPTTQTEVRSFLGTASYYRRFMQNFGTIARPLHWLTEKNRRRVPDCLRDTEKEVGGGPYPGLPQHPS